MALNLFLITFRYTLKICLLVDGVLRYISLIIKTYFYYFNHITVYERLLGTEGKS